MKIKTLEGILRPSTVNFAEEKHTYTHITGDLYTGCSTISGTMDKPFLAPWYAKEAIDAVRAKLPEIALLLEGEAKPETQVKLNELLDECKMSAKKKSQLAAEQGTEAHAYFEQAILATLNPELPVPELPTKNKEVMNAIVAFRKWESEFKPEYLACEEVLDSEVHKVGGKIDALANINGLSSLIDFKTSSQLSESYLIQLAGYDLMLEEMGFKPRAWMLVRCPKDGKPFETITITNQQDQKFYREVFLHLREAHRFMVYIENNKKSYGKMKTDKKEKIIDYNA